MATRLVARLEVPLEADEGDGWRSLCEGKPSPDLRSQCNVATGECVPVRLLSVLFDTPGSERGFPIYRTALTVSGECLRPG